MKVDYTSGIQNILKTKIKKQTDNKNTCTYFISFFDYCMAFLQFKNLTF